MTKLGGINTVLATIGAIAGNRTYGGRVVLLIDYLRAAFRYARAGWGPTDARVFRCAGFRLASRHPRSFYTTFKEIFIEEAYLFEDLPERPFIVDCGANIGMATAFFKRLRPDAEILAVEPSPTSVDLLKRNLHLNRLEGVRVVAAALADREGPALLTEDYPSGVTSRLSPDGKIAVELRRLAGLLDRPVDLLKIDVEGMDIVVLEDLERAGKLHLVARVAVEYGLHEGSQGSRLSPLFALLERNDFSYAVDARSARPLGAFQSITVRAWRHRATASAAIGAPGAAVTGRSRGSD